MIGDPWPVLCNGGLGYWFFSINWICRSSCAANGTPAGNHAGLTGEACSLMWFYHYGWHHFISCVMAPYSNVESVWIQVLSQAETLLRFPRFQWELYNYRRMTGALRQIGVKTAHLHADGRLPSARLKCPLDGELRVQGYELRWSADFCWRCSAGVLGYSGGAVVPLQSLCLLLSNWSLQFYPRSFGTIEFVFLVDRSVCA